MDYTKITWTPSNIDSRNVTATINNALLIVVFDESRSEQPWIWVALDGANVLGSGNAYAQLEARVNAFHRLRIARLNGLAA